MKQRVVLVAAMILVFVVVLFVWWGSWQVIVNYPGFQDWSQRGSFGDMFGAVSALFSGLAFCGLLITIGLQSWQLALQNRELEQTRIDLAEQKEQLQTQSKTADLQRFEGTFFRLLTTQQNLVASMTIEESGVATVGRLCFKIIYEELCQSFVDNGSPTDVDSVFKEINEQYARIYDDVRYNLDVYFGNLYSLISFVDQNNIVFDRYFYIDFVRTQLSVYEVLLLYYHCLTSFGDYKLKPLAKVYRLFDDLPQSKLATAQHKDLIGRSHRYQKRQEET